MLKAFLNSRIHWAIASENDQVLGHEVYKQPAQLVEKTSMPAVLELKGFLYIR